MRRGTAALGVLTLLPALALAGEPQGLRQPGSPEPTASRPPATPTRDVDVTYQTPTASPADPRQDNATPPPFRQRMRWLQAASRMRVDPGAGGIYMLTDYRAHTLAIVNLAGRQVLDLPAPAGTSLAPGGSDDVRFTRLGDETVAGLGCTDWRMTSPRGEALLACITADGVMLRLSNGARVVAEAVSVAYAAQDPPQFTVPDGYRHVSRPPS